MLNIVTEFSFKSILLCCALFGEVREACHEWIETKRARRFLKNKKKILNTIFNTRRNVSYLEQSA